MYWNTNPATSLHLESLLNKEDVTLEEVMDDERVLQECKSQNKHLIDYLIRQDVLEQLVKLTTEEPPGNEDNAVKYKYPNIACELLTSEVPQLSERLANNEALLRKLYSFLDTDPPLNPLLASFFSKTLSVLITRNSDQNWYSYQFTCLKVLEFLKLKENSIASLLKHLRTSAIMDLVFKLITKVEDSDMKENILNWLDEQQLVEKLVGLLDPSEDSDVHYNAAQLLCDVIRTSRSNKIQVLEPNKILDRIESPETVSLLLDFMLKEPRCETSIVGGISVLLTLLEDKCGNGDRYAYEDSTQYNADYLRVVASTTQAILPRLKDFHNILENPPVKPTVKTTITVLEPPLGNTRVEVAKLLSVLVASNSDEINKKLTELDTINILLDLFFKYTWNNFLHTQVQKCLAFALDSGTATSENGEIRKTGLIAHIFSECHLIQRILDAWQDNEIQQTEHKRPRRGYMGHLIEIANNIVHKAETHSFGALLKELLDNETFNKWENFVYTKLAEIYWTYSTCLGDYQSSANNKDGGDGKEVTFENYSQEALAPSFTGEFGSFQEDQFNDDEDVLSESGNSNFLKVDFNVSEEEDRDNEHLDTRFMEKFCSKFQAINAYNADRDWPALESSSSDEEDAEHLKKEMNFEKDSGSLDLNMLSSWSVEPEVPPAESLNPWESSTAYNVSSPDLGWANFESAAFVANFGLNLNPDINTTIATSGSYDIGTAPLDLTPSESNNSVGDVFSAENSEVERPRIVENNPKTILLTEIEHISKRTENIGLNSSSQISNEKVANDCPKEETYENKSLKCVSLTQKSEIIGDVNTVGKISEPNESRLSTSSVTASNDKEPESGDTCHLLKENVQAVPNDTAQNSLKSVESSNSQDSTQNGPI